MAGVDDASTVRVTIDATKEKRNKIPSLSAIEYVCIETFSAIYLRTGHSAQLRFGSYQKRCCVAVPLNA